MNKVLLVFPPREKGSTGYYFRVQQEIDIILKRNNVRVFNTVSKIDSAKEKEKLSKRLIKFLILLPSLIKEIKNSDIILLYTSPTWYLTVSLAKLFKKKVILDHFTTYAYNFEFSNNPLRAISRFLDTFYFVFFDKIITHSESMKAVLIKFFRIPEEKIIVTYSSVDTKLFSPRGKDHTLLKKYKLRKDQKIVMYSGLFHPFHGVDTILKMTKLFNKENIVFFILGRKLERNSKNVISINPVRYKDLPEYLSLADIWIGSVGRGIQGERALSSNLVAAMSMGLIVVVGDWNENKKVIKDGINGFLVKRNDHEFLFSKIKEILKRKDLKKIKSNARKTVEDNFSTKTMEQEFSKVFNKL